MKNALLIIFILTATYVSAQKITTSEIVVEEVDTTTVEGDFKIKGDVFIDSEYYARAVVAATVSGGSHTISIDDLFDEFKMDINNETTYIDLTVFFRANNGNADRWECNGFRLKGETSWFLPSWDQFGWIWDQIQMVSVTSNNDILVTFGNGNNHKLMVKIELYSI